VVWRSVSATYLPARRGCALARMTFESQRVWPTNPIGSSPSSQWCKVPIGWIYQFPAAKLRTTAASAATASSNDRACGGTVVMTALTRRQHWMMPLGARRLLTRLRQVGSWEDAARSRLNAKVRSLRSKPMLRSSACGKIKAPEIYGKPHSEPINQNHSIRLS
jgi:hypothetical protein